MTSDNIRPEGGQSPPEEERERPVVNDRRRIDPQTGEVRATDPAADDAPVADDDGAAGADPVASGALAEAKAEAADLAEQLARRNADLYNLQQEYNGYVRRSKAGVGDLKAAGQAEVVDALLGVLDEIELARQHGDLTGPVGAIAEKVEVTLEQRFGLERYGAAGEEFDPELHDALMSSPDPQVATSTITQVMQPGYRMAEKVIRAARVAVAVPED